MLFSDPCVFAVNRNYQIIFNTLEPGAAWIECAGKTYRDSENGLVRTETLVHRVELPMAELDSACSYTVCFRALPERRPYFPELGPLYRKEYMFRPVPEKVPVRAVMLADTHSMVREPCQAASAAGEFDFLLLNGDIPAESKRMEDIRAIYEITGALTHGTLPVVFARGNHDCRGRLATELMQFIGTRDRETFFTFRLGPVWGIVLDCGEDKQDSDPEYGGLVNCHEMRIRETVWLREVIARAEEEYLAPEAKIRIAICHIPFCTETMADENAKFDIEKEIYKEWTELLGQMKLDIMLSGHTHTMETVLPGSPRARYGMSFPVIIGSLPIRPDSVHPERAASFCGVLLTFDREEILADSISSADGKAPMARFVHSGAVL